MHVGIRHLRTTEAVSVLLHDCCTRILERIEKSSSGNQAKIFFGQIVTTEESGTNVKIIRIIITRLTRLSDYFPDESFRHAGSLGSTHTQNVSK